MHGTGVKITDAQQAKIYNMYKNTKLKLLKTTTVYVILARHEGLPEDDVLTSKRVAANHM